MEITQDPDSGLYNLQGGSIFDQNNNILFQMSSVSSRLNAPALLTKPEELKSEVFSPNTAGVLKYGENNTYPQGIRSIVEGNNTLDAGIFRRANSIFANGIITKDPDGNPVNYGEFTKFKRSHTSFASQIYQQICDMLVFRWSPMEYFFDNKGEKVLGIFARNAEQCRYGWDDKNKVLDGTIWMDAQWDKYGMSIPKTAIQRPLIYESNFAVESLKERIKYKKYVKTIQFPHTKNGYPKSSIQALIDMGWIDISNDEPRYIKALIQNKATVLTVVKIKDWYWEARFGKKEWGEMTPTERQSKKKLEITDFNKMLSGIDNAGKTLIVDVKTEFLQNRSANGQIIGKTNFDNVQEAWEVTFLEVAKLDGSISTYANTARKEIMFGIGLDWMTGGGPNQENQTGGSAKQQSKTIELILDEFLRTLICEQFYFIRDYNGWSEEMEFDFNLPNMPTLATVNPKDRQITASDRPS
ncbi:hypothetical protein VB796_08670 [Arcicella sp. LKC2W]|uniref:hypothetical protein n=1 Tax=Arcicella sp. LKC2W TaxID=2984198 RepID=UPI002B21E965|nr:hypothetical protein [Arcicella sp. LKC2W]MEA5459107.1 hypothetical protein [Arcicella sp. LKC2W]